MIDIKKQIWNLKRLEMFIEVVLTSILSVSQKAMLSVLDKTFMSKLPYSLVFKKSSAKSPIKDLKNIRDKSFIFSSIQICTIYLYLKVNSSIAVSLKFWLSLQLLHVFSFPQINIWFNNWQIDSSY